MTGKIVSQIGFFGLNGAKVIFGLIIFLILDAIFGFKVTNSLLKIDLPTSVQALIFAFIIACANLLGIIVGEILNLIFVIYWRKVNNIRLIKFQDDIKRMNKDKFPDIGVYHYFFNEMTWKDRYFRSFKQDFMTRLILILALLSAGYCIAILQVVHQYRKIIIPEEDIFSKFVNENSQLILLAIFGSLLLLFISLRITTEKNVKDILIALKDFFYFFPLLLYPLVILQLNLSSSYVLLHIILLITMSFLAPAWIIENVDLSALENNKPKEQERQRISIKTLLITLPILSCTLPVSLIIAQFSVLSWFSWIVLLIMLILLVILFVFMCYIGRKVDKTIRNREKRNSKEKKQRFFGRGIENHSRLWFNLIITYYQLFFYGARNKTLSKVEQYQFVILGVYIYQAISKYFLKPIDKSGNLEKSNNRNQNIESEREHLNYIEYFKGIIDLVDTELQQEKIDIAIQFYNSLEDAILVYFVSDSYINTDGKGHLAEFAASLYVIDSDLVYELVKTISEESTLNQFYEEVKKHHRDKIDRELLLVFLRNKNVSGQLLYSMKKEILKETESKGEES